MDEQFMDLALEQARKAEKAGEVPVGAVIVDADGNVIARGFNQPISTNDPTAHAEIVHARIQRLVYGAADARAGAAGSIYNVVSDSRLNHQVTVAAGIREIECRQIVQTFFERKRT